MASPTLDCPHCKAVLRPANPVPAGKKVACPKCKQSFTAGGEDPTPAPKPKPVDDEDDRNITSYGVSAVDDSPYEEPEAKGGADGPKKKKKKKEEINYGPDNTLKDLRGPAIGIVTPISNNYLWHCAIMIVLAFASMMIGVWPFIFQDRLLNPELALDEFYKTSIANEGKNGGQSKWKQRQDDAKLDKLEWPIPVDRNGKKVREPDYGKSEMTTEEADAGEAYIGRAEKPTRLAWVISSFVVLAWAFVMAIGGVKMVTLESYGWAMTSAIMALVPVNLLGWLMLFWKSWDKLHNDLFCWISFYILPIMNIFSILFGIWMLTALTDQKVIDGFNFKGTDNE